MKASETSLRNLLEGTKQFQVPLFQRSYSWKKDNWQMLWEDLLMIYDDDSDDPFFMGSIVTQSIPGTADGISPFIIIDGQQRLTTLTILLAAIRYSLDSENSLKEEIYETHLINKYQSEDYRYKLLPTQTDKKSYKKIIDLELENIEELSRESKIFELFKFFDKSINKSSNKIEFRKLKNIILERLFFVNITSGEEDNPYLIFESLNYKGQELTQSDLVRNYIFMLLEPDKREKIYNETWLLVQNKFLNQFENNQEKVAEELTNALWFYLRKDGKSVLQRNIYKEFQNRFKKQEKNIENKLTEITQFVTYYLNLSFPNDKNIINESLSRFKILDFKVVYVFLLNVFHDYQKNHLSEYDFLKVLNYLESYFVRRWIVDISTRSLGNICNKLYSLLSLEEGNLSKKLYKVLDSFKDNDRWPDDQEFTQAIITKSIYKKKTNNERVKLVLSSIEKYHTKEIVSSDNLTIEHILPQTLNNEWKLMLKNQTEKLDLYIHTLGNLTLTAYNGELSNKSFSKKVDYFNNSNLRINHYFREQNIEIWNLEAIKKRSKYLTDIAVKVWIR